MSFLGSPKKTLPLSPSPATDLYKGQRFSQSKTITSAAFVVQTHATSVGTEVELQKGFGEDQNTNQNYSLKQKGYSKKFNCWALELGRSNSFCKGVVIVFEMVQIQLPWWPISTLEAERTLNANSNSCLTKLYILFQVTLLQDNPFHAITILC